MGSKKILDDFHNARMDISRLNYGIITVVPKTKVTKQNFKTRTISLVNVIFKILIKFFNN